MDLISSCPDQSSEPSFDRASRTFQNVRTPFQSFYRVSSNKDVEFYSWVLWVLTEVSKWSGVIMLPFKWQHPREPCSMYKHQHEESPQPWFCLWLVGMECSLHEAILSVWFHLGEVLSPNIPKLLITFWNCILSHETLSVSEQQALQGRLFLIGVSAYFGAEEELWGRTWDPGRIGMKNQA